MKLIVKLATLALLAFSLSGCFGPEAVTLKVLAGSELKDIEPKLDEIAAKTGVRLEMHYIGTLDGADKIVYGDEKYDLAWFSHAKYLSLLQENKKLIKSEEKIGLSPVIPAVKESLARKWGWIDNPNITWADIAAKARSGEFRYAMTDPTASNSGFSTVMGVQAAFSGSSDVITANSVDVQKLQDFFSGQTITSGSSGWLADAYIRDQGSLDGLFNYESILMNLNASGKLREPLVLIYPEEGVVTADYPLMLLDNSQRAAYKKLVTYLKTPEFQQWMMDETNRRPVIPQLKASAKFPDGLMLELPFPSDIRAVNEILFAYLDIHRRPSHSIFVLDVSDSMYGEGLRNLKTAMHNLTGEDKSVTGQFARFRNRERVTLIPFNHEVHVSPTVEIDGSGEQIEKLRTMVDGFKAVGTTSIYEAMNQAYALAEEALKHDPQRFYTIVLMSDGTNTEGREYKDFARYYREHAAGLKSIRTFPVLFGYSDDKEMKQIAKLTGGRVFDSRQHSLAQVFKKIRGYQ